MKAPKQRRHEAMIARLRADGKDGTAGQSRPVDVAGGGGRGSNPTEALSGNLGDVIDTDAQLRRYCDLILAAPHELLKEFDSLYHASVAAYNERGLQP